MLSVLVIDDEPMSVRRLTLLLEQTEMVNVIGTFTDPLEAFSSDLVQKADVAFVDIEMPSMTGLSLAERLQEKCPTLEVIMVTAHDQYALEAFQAHASGYLLKPVSVEGITRQLSVIMRKRVVQTRKPDSPVMTIHTFGQFQCAVGDGEKEYFQWRTAKTRELMAFLHYHQGSPAHRDTIVDNLWPDKDLERGIKNFHVTGYYLRETLKKRNLEHLLERKNGAYRLRWDLVGSDEKVFMEGAEAMATGKATVEQLQTMVRIHQQPYCGVDDYFWADDRRRQYESVYMQTLERLAEEVDNLKDDNRKIQLLLQILRQDPYNETIHEKIIDVYVKQQRMEEAGQYLEAMEKRFREELGVHPSAHLYKKTNV